MSFYRPDRETSFVATDKVPVSGSSQLKLRLRDQALILAAVPLLLELVLFANLYAHWNESETQAKRQVKSLSIIAKYSRLIYAVDEGLNAVGGYLTTGGNDIYGAQVEMTMKEIPETVRELKELVPPSSQFQRIDQHSQTIIRELVEARQLMAQSKPEETAVVLRNTSRKLRRLKLLLEENSIKLIALEQETEKKSAESHDQASALLRTWLGFGIALNVAIAIMLALFFMRNIAARVRVMTDNSVRLASGLPLLARVPGNDEIGELDKGFHRMASLLAEAARKERAMIENAVDVICSINEDGQFIEVSPASLTVWGYAPEELIGQRFISLITESEKNSTLQHMDEAVASKKPFSFENRLRRKDGVIVSLTWSGLWSEKDRALFCVAHDVTERKRVEELKRDFVAMISHDLRTPLSSVQVYLEMVADGFFNEKTDQLQKKARLSESDVSRLIGLINNLLDLEKMESGRMEVNAGDTDVERIIERSTASVAALAERKKIELKTEISRAAFFADEDQLVQVLVNLLSNALKFSPDGKPVFVRTLVDDKFIEFQVEDQGRGISAEFKDKIFDRFQQVELSDSRVKGGSGLGLAICKAIVEAHSGSIGVDSTEGVGSKFWFRIPRTASGITIDHEPNAIAS